MAWTGRRTTTGLAIAIGLGVAAVGIFLVGKQSRDQIVDRGRQTEAVVTADHDNELDHWYTVSYPAQGADRSADLRAPWLIDKIPVGTVLTVYVEPDDPGRIATANGYPTPVWTPAPGWLAVLAMLAAFISIVGQAAGTRQRRRQSSPPRSAKDPEIDV